MAHRAKWGWYPCDYETYQLLKNLNRLCEQARRKYAAWQRWQRKMPHNRVLRRTVVDESGEKIGTEVVGPWPEPALPALFCVRRQVLSNWSNDGRPLKTPRLIETVEFDDHGIEDAYRCARRPAETEQQVERLKLSPEDVRRLAKQAGLGS
jgi:hypothetical protein